MSDLQTKLHQLEVELTNLKQQAARLRNGNNNSQLCHKCSSKSTNFPKRILLVRHGESYGNIDETIYTVQPDWKVPLTSKGREQAVEAGKKIKALIGDEPLSIYCSPYLRTKQTLLGIMSQLESNPVINAREEPRLTEQQFGNFQKEEDMKRYKKERNQFGRFYYRFPQGESGLDVYDRVSLFIGTLFRDWRKFTNLESGNVLIVTHGLTLRLFLMRWLQYSVEEFEMTTNPSNASVIIMTRHSYSVPHPIPSSTTTTPTTSTTTNKNNNNDTTSNHTTNHNRNTTTTNNNDNNNTTNTAHSCNIETDFNNPTNTNTNTTTTSSNNNADDTITTNNHNIATISTNDMNLNSSYLYSEANDNPIHVKTTIPPTNISKKIHVHHETFYCLDQNSRLALGWNISKTNRKYLQKKLISEVLQSNPHQLHHVPSCVDITNTINNIKVMNNNSSCLDNICDSLVNNDHEMKYKTIHDNNNDNNNNNENDSALIYNMPVDADIENGHHNHDSTNFNTKDGINCTTHSNDMDLQKNYDVSYYYHRQIPTSLIDSVTSQCTPNVPSECTPHTNHLPHVQIYTNTSNNYFSSSTLLSSPNSPYMQSNTSCYSYNDSPLSCHEPILEGSDYEDNLLTPQYAYDTMHLPCSSHHIHTSPVPTQIDRGHPDEHKNNENSINLHPNTWTSTFRSDLRLHNSNMNPHKNNTCTYHDVDSIADGADKDITITDNSSLLSPSLHSSVNSQHSHHHTIENLVSEPINTNTSTTALHVNSTCSSNSFSHPDTNSNHSLYYTHNNNALSDTNNIRSLSPSLLSQYQLNNSNPSSQDRVTSFSKPPLSPQRLSTSSITYHDNISTNNTFEIQDRTSLYDLNVILNEVKDIP